MDQLRLLPDWARWASFDVVPLAFRRNGQPIWPMRGGAEGMIGGTPISELPRSSFAYCEPDDGPCHFPIKDKDGKPDEAHVRNALSRLAQSPFGDKARAAVEAAAKELGIGEPAERTETALRDGSFLVRTLPPTITYEDGESVRAADLRAEGGDSDSPGYLTGRFAVFDTWTEVRSRIEGHFMERTGEGAFRKAISEGRPPIIFQHGWDPELGTRPIAPTEDIGTDTRGGHYGGPLLKGVPELVVSGLRAGLYGSSYRFRAIRPEVNPRPKPSANNPEGIPEVTIREATLKEIGPGMFPVYKETSAIVRSETDEYLLSRFGDPEQILGLLAAQRGDLALSSGEAGDGHSTEESRTEPPPPAATTTVVPASVSDVPQRFRSRDEWLGWLSRER